MLETILTVFYLIIFSGIILKARFFKIEGISQKYILSFYYIKFAAACLLSLLYTYYYSQETSDIFRFFRDAKVIYSMLFDNPLYYIKMLTGYDDANPELRPYLDQINNWTKQFDSRMYNDTQTIIRFNAIVMLFSFGKFYVHNVFSAFVSFLGTIALLKFFLKHFPTKKIELIISLFFIPSVLVWASSVMKESLLLFGTGIFLYNVRQYFSKKHNTTNMFGMILGLWILLITKYYVFCSLLPGLIIYIWDIKSKKFKLLYKTLVVLGIFLVLFILNELFNSNFSILYLISIKQNDFIAFTTELGNVGSYIELTPLNSTFASYIKVFPEAFINSFFRPWPWEINNLLAIIPMFENIIIFVLIALAIKFNSLESKNANIIIFTSIFTFLLFILSGYTTPVIGALVRYKVPALPFIYSILICIIDFKKIFYQLYKK